MSRRNPTVWLLSLPAAIWLAIFFIVPLLLMAVFSLRPDIRGGLFNFDWTPTLEHYARVIGTQEDAGYLPLLWVSIQVAFVVALISIVLACPLAYLLAFRFKERYSV